MREKTKSKGVREGMREKAESKGIQEGMGEKAESKAVREGMWEKAEQRCDKGIKEGESKDARVRTERELIREISAR